MDSKQESEILYERVPTRCKFDQLDSFLLELDSDISRRKQQTTVNTDDVFHAVKTLIQMTLDAVAQLDPVMKVRKFHPVGSFIEGTKVGTPNEFDFVAEIDSFNVKMTEVRDECHNIGAVHLITPESASQTTTTTTIGTQIENLLHNQTDERTGGAGTNVNYLSPLKFRLQFWNVFTAAATYLSSTNMTVRTGSGELSLVPNIPQFIDMYSKGPNIELHMVWTYFGGQKKLGLSADVTPAIRVLDSIPETIGVDLARLDRCCARTGYSTSDVLLIPTFNRECKNAKDLTDTDNLLCWRLSFSIIETNLLREMSPNHRLCLRILKFLKSVPKDAREQMRELGLDLEADTYSSTMIALSHSQGEMHLLTTYMLKMTVLDHNDACAGDTDSAAQCMLNIVRLLQRRIKDKFLPNFFLPGKSAWPRGPVVLLEKSMERVINFLQKVMSDSNYSYDESYKEFLEVQEFVTSRDGC